MKAAYISFCGVLASVAKSLIGALLGIIVLVTLAAVWSRYVLDAPIGWTEQVSNIMFVWIVFVGAAVLYRQHLHIAVDYFLLMLPKSGQQIAFWIIEVGNLIFMAVLFGYSLKLCINVLPNTYGALDISPAYMYFAAPVSCLLMMFFFIEKIIDPERRVPSGHAGDF